IDNIQAGSVEIEHNLSLIRSSLFRLTRIQNCDEVTNVIRPDCLDLVFYILCSKEKDILVAQAKIRKFILEPIPIIFFIDKPPERKSPFNTALDNYISLSEISPPLLEKSIFFALEKERSNRELESIRQENIALSSQLLATKNLFQTIVDHTSTLVWMCDAAGNTTFFNQAWSRILGQESNTHLARDWLINIHPLDLDYCEKKFYHALAKKKGFTISYRLIKLDSNYRWISNYAVPQFTVDGAFKGLVGYCFDITDHKKTEQKLIQRAASDRLLAQITQKIHTSLHLDQILQTTVDEVKQFLLAEKIQVNRIDETNQLTLLFESRLIGSSFSCDITQPKEVPAVLFENNIALLSAGKSVTQDFADRSIASKHSCSTLLIPIICEAKLWGLICIENCSFARSWNVEEIYLLERVAMVLSVAIKQSKLYHQLEKANQELKHLSVMDGLTRIANRRKFDQYIAAEWNRLSREQVPLSLIMCDIDCFKLYNDTYGHQAGDLCLIEVAQAIQKVIKRPTDLLARYGGEEFVLVLPKTPLEGAKYLAQQIRLQIESLKIPHLRSTVDLYVTISLGVSSCIPSGKMNFEMLVAAADRGLYQAKAKGRNRAVECEIEPE
ncbi:MAG: diguanylate cyclase, partial [Cyanobacteria bacterium J06621_12]